MPIRLFFTTLLAMELRPCLLMSIFLALLAWTVVLMLLRLLQVSASVAEKACRESGRRQRNQCRNIQSQRETILQTLRSA